MAEAGGAVVALARPTGELVYLASGRLGRHVWVADPARARAFATLAEANRAALLARCRPGRPQPYAVPAERNGERER